VHGVARVSGLTCVCTRCLPCETGSGLFWSLVLRVCSLYLLLGGRDMCRCYGLVAASFAYAKGVHREQLSILPGALDQ
jgi:hypothetical protein